MAFLPSREIFVQFGPFTITWYAMFIITGAFLAYLICEKNLKRMGVPKEKSEDLFMGVFGFGILGARIWYVIFMYKEIYAGQPFFKMFKIWEGGLAIQGGIMAAIIFTIWFCKKNGYDFFQATDCCMPNVLIAQAIGRWGNFMNQEAHGTEVAREFLEGLHLPDFIIEGMNIGGKYYHPTYLYESIGNIILFFIISLVVYRIYKKHGQVFFSYFIGYGIVRFFVEGLRTDSLMIMGFRTAQILAIAGLIIGIIGIIVLQFKGRDVDEKSRLKLL